MQQGPEHPHNQQPQPYSYYVPSPSLPPSLPPPRTHSLLRFLRTVIVCLIGCAIGYVVCGIFITVSENVFHVSTFWGIAAYMVGFAIIVGIYGWLRGKKTSV